MATTQNHQQYLTNLLTSFPEWQEISPSAQKRLLNTLEREIGKNASEPIITRFANEIALMVHSSERMVIEQIIKKLQLSKLIFEQIEHIISERLVREISIDLNAQMGRLGLDKLDLIWVILRCEQIFHIQIDEEAVISPLVTLQTYVAYVSQLYFKEVESNSQARFMNAS